MIRRRDIIVVTIAVATTLVCVRAFGQVGVM